MNHLLGKRIRLSQPMIDPDPIPLGSTGLVTYVNPVPTLGFTQVCVKWDNGRTLMLSVPPDEIEEVT